MTVELEIAPGVIEVDVEDDRAEDERLRGESIAIVRRLILQAHPELVEELITGETLTELMGSVAVAQAAYQRIAGTVRSETPAVVAPVVPAGGNVARLMVEDMGPDGLILRGMKEMRRGRRE